MDDMIPIYAVLELVGDLCSNCQAKVRQRIAKGQTKTGLNFVRSGVLQIVEDAAIDWKVTVDAIRARSNSPGIVMVRREIAEKARRAGYSLPQIGKAINRHHSTVVNLLQNKPRRYQK